MNEGYAGAAMGLAIMTDHLTAAVRQIRKQLAAGQDRVLLAEGVSAFLKKGEWLGQERNMLAAAMLLLAESERGFSTALPELPVVPDDAREIDGYAGTAADLAPTVQEGTGAAAEGSAVEGAGVAEGGGGPDVHE